MDASKRSLLYNLSALVALVVCLSVVFCAEMDTNVEYRRLFSTKAKPLQPMETLEALKNLRDELRARQDAISKTRLEEIETLLQYRDITKCDSEVLWKLSCSLEKYDGAKQKVRSIVAYLEYCRDMHFQQCAPSLDAEAQGALDSFARKPSYLQIVRFQKFIASNTWKLPYLTFPHHIKGELLNYIAKEYDKQEFEKKFNKTLRRVCSDIEEESEFTDKYAMFFRSKRLAGQMDSHLKDLFRMRNICKHVTARPEVVFSELYNELLLRRPPNSL